MNRPLLIVACALLAATRVAAQEAPVRSPAFVPSWHWSQQAVRSAATTGLDSVTSDPRFAPLTWEDVHTTLTRAATAAAAAGRLELAAHFTAQLERLAQERSRIPGVDQLALYGGWASARGDARAGDGYFREEDWTGADTLAAASGIGVEVDASGARGALGWSVAAGHALGETFVQEAALALRVRTLQFWAGRRPVRFAMGRTGGITVGPGEAGALPLLDRTSAQIDGVGLFLHEPFRLPVLPWTVGRIEVFLGRLGAHGRNPEPFIGGGRLIGHPFTPRITLGVYRAAVFGGAGNELTGRTLLEAVLGIHADSGRFANQVVGMDIGFRPPLGAWPLQLYVEWGFDDSSGAISDVPAFIAGAELGSLPGIPELGFGIEGVRFWPACCSNPPWYRNIFSRAGWADGNRLLAHPLGGVGEQLSAYADLATAAADVNARGFVRYRGADNLFSPGREGNSAGAGARVQLRRHLPLLLDWTGEWGSGWSAISFFAGAQLRF